MKTGQPGLLRLARSTRLSLSSCRTLQIPRRRLAACPHQLRYSSKIANVARTAEAARETSADTRSFGTRMKNLLVGTSIGISLVLGYYYITDTRAGAHRWLVVPLLRYIYDDPEEAHLAGTKALKILHDFGINPRERGNPDAVGDLAVEVRSLITATGQTILSIDFGRGSYEPWMHSQRLRVYYFGRSSAILFPTR